MEVLARVTFMSFGGFLDSSSISGGRLGGDSISFPYSSGSGSSSKDELSAINMPSGAIAQPRLVTPSLAKSMFNSSGLSLALVWPFPPFPFFPTLPPKKYKNSCPLILSSSFSVFFFGLGPDNIFFGVWQQTGIESHGDVTQLGDGSFELAAAGMTNRRSRDALDQEHESRSGSDNMDGAASGEEPDAADKPPRKKRYHRHTPQQIQELEAYDFMAPPPFSSSFLRSSSFFFGIIPMNLFGFSSFSFSQKKSF